MPGQQRGGRDDPMQAQLAGEQAGQRGQDRPARPLSRGPVHLTAQHRDFVAHDQDLYVLGDGVAGEQPEPAEHRNRDQIQQSQQHDAGSRHDHVYR